MASRRKLPVSGGVRIFKKAVEARKENVAKKETGKQLAKVIKK